MSNQVSIKSPQEIEKMRIAGKLASQTLEFIADYVKEGVSTQKLDELCHEYIIDELQAIPAPLNYRGFPKSICTSINHVVCHGIPTDKEILKNGDIINIDITVIKEGYHGDTSNMFAIGNVQTNARKLVKITKECLYDAIRIIKPGLSLGDIGYTIQKKAEANNFSVVRDFCGHGIGKNFHEFPNVMHYGRPKQGFKLVEGMTFTIEPMINLGDYKTKILSDKWTAITRDKKLSAQFEHTILVTEQGYEVLTLRTDEKI